MTKSLATKDIFFNGIKVIVFSYHNKFHYGNWSMVANLAMVFWNGSRIGFECLGVVANLAMEFWNGSRIGFKCLGVAANLCTQCVAKSRKLSQAWI